MANKYCDHGLYAAPITGGTVPTASEDGNGKGTGAAAMATLVLALTGQPTAGQAITVAGVTFTAVASGATGNQFNIGASAAATATNLAAAINASTPNAVKPVGVINATAPLRNVVNACVSGSTVTVYTRCSGADWNSVTETSTLSNCTVTQWSGGTDGAWGYLANEAAIFPTSQAINAYGIWALQTPYLGTIDAGDVVNIRSNKTITKAPSSGQTITLANMGSASSPVLFLFDNSTIWSDGANPKFTINWNCTSNGTLTFTFSSATFAVVKASVYADNTRGFEVSMPSPGNAATALAISSVPVASGGSLQWDGPAFRAPHAGGSGIIRISQSNAASPGNKPFTMRNCLFSYYKQRTTGFLGNATIYAALVRLTNCQFELTNATDVFNPVFDLPAGVGTGVELVGCKFTGFVAGSRLLSAVALTAAAGLTAYDCDFGNITALGPNFITTDLSVANLSRLDRAAIGFMASSKYGTRDYISDTPQGMVQWNGSLNFPTLNAVLLDATPWSIRVIPTTFSGGLSPMAPLVLPGISKLNSLATAARTLTLPFGLEKSLSWTKKDVWFDLEYIDESGVRRYESTLDYAAGALTAGTDVWSTMVNDGGVDRFTWGSPTTLYFNRYRLQLTTAYQIATGTEFTVFINIGNTVADTTKMLFIDPEVLVS